MTTAENTLADPRILRQVREADRQLTDCFSEKLQINRGLTRALVSFQANKEAPGYRWFKFKEGFSASLVTHALQQLGVTSGKILDPFAGSGSTLFAASAIGLDGVGIELLPVGCEIMRARRDAYLNKDAVSKVLQKWIDLKPWHTSNGHRVTFPHLRITDGAFPPKNEDQLERYLGVIKTVRNQAARAVLRLAALSILESISYTRKDGQYLRWDFRSGRRLGGRQFHKGPIRTFDEAILDKLSQIKEDITKNSDLCNGLVSRNGTSKLEIICGSCLEELPRLCSDTFSVLMTSPPYCNRYDYTRTYALELALLGMDDDAVRWLRQTMLSCTVENKEKNSLQLHFLPKRLEQARRVFSEQDLLSHLLEYLETLRDTGFLNNAGIPRMVRNYFWEMTLVILECARVLKPGAPMIMVNDNVRYAGVPIPVDLILSRIAECVGFKVETIWVLPKGKGNSSQQMGLHGREELRKCVYVWSKTVGGKSANVDIENSYAAA